MVEGEDEDDDDGTPKEHWMIATVQRLAVQAVHRSAKSIAGHSETLRIFLNAAKIVTHLWGTLTYCVRMPQSMNKILELASVFALDIISDGKPKCAFPDFTYITRVKIAAFAPLAIAALLVIYGVLRAAWDHGTRKSKSRVTAMQSKETRMARQRGSQDSVLKSGFWRVASAMLMITDFIFPTITRTLLQYFTCHELKTPIDSDDGRWLEASYEIECGTDAYNAYLPLAALFGGIYSLGVPLIFYYLVKRFQEYGMRGDKVVQKAIGWMCPSKK